MLGDPPPMSLCGESLCGVEDMDLLVRFLNAGKARGQDLRPG